jgi:hypothetical protein
MLVACFNFKALFIWKLCLQASLPALLWEALQHLREQAYQKLKAMI